MAAGIGNLLGTYIPHSNYGSGIYLSNNSNITWECTNNRFITNIPNTSYNWNYLSVNPNITLDIIETNMEKPWDWEGYSNNKFTKQSHILPYKT